jgi:hypothetical protein
MNTSAAMHPDFFKAEALLYLLLNLAVLDAELYETTITQMSYEWSR